MNYDTLKYIGACTGLWLGGSALIGTALYFLNRNTSRRFRSSARENELNESGSLQINLDQAVETIAPKSQESSAQNDNWYLWLNLTKDEYRNSFAENHHELRSAFKKYGEKYPHLQIHDGDFDPLPDCVIVLTSRSVPSSRYCMAKTTSSFKPELDNLKGDLAKASLEKRIIGPTNDLGMVEEYGDNFELQKKLVR